MRSLTLALILVLQGCITTEEATPYFGGGGVIHQSQLDQEWEVRAGGRTIGRALRMREPSGKTHLIVQNRYGQDRGFVDEEGRATLWRPHEEPEWIHSGSRREGICRILGVDEVTLVPVPAPR